jgi:hypothetical protein
LSLSFWGESQMGVLGGLLIKKPLFYNDLGAGALYREFKTMADITRTETVLNTIIAFDDLLGLMDIELGDIVKHRFLTYQNLILTLWANHHLGLSASWKTPVPIPLDQFRQFFQELWVAGSKPRRIGDTIRELFLGWVAQRSGLATFEITDRMASALEQLFEDVEQELGAVQAGDLDARFIQMFLLRP